MTLLCNRSFLLAFIVDFGKDLAHDELNKVRVNIVAVQ